MKRGLRSYALLVRQLADQPSTPAEMVERFGISRSNSRRIPRSLLDLGVLSVVEWRRDNPKGPAVRVFGVGETTVSQTVPTKHGRPSAHAGAKPRVLHIKPELIAFAAIWEALVDPTTAVELAEETGIYPSTARELISTMADLKLIGIAGWTRPRNRWGPYVAQYARGVTKNASKPKREDVLVSMRRYRERQAAARQRALIAGARAA